MAVMRLERPAASRTWRLEEFGVLRDSFTVSLESAHQIALDDQELARDRPAGDRLAEGGGTVDLQVPGRPQVTPDGSRLCGQHGGGTRRCSPPSPQHREPVLDTQLASHERR